MSLVTLTGCVRVNADHCGNLEGDSTCQERGEMTLFCSVCVSDNDGCVASTPTPDCRLDSGGPDTTNAGSTASGTGSTGSGAASDTAPETTMTATMPSTVTATSAEDSSGSGTSEDLCGNGTVNVGEECDGDVGDEDCTSLLVGTGSVSCTQECEYDISNCTRRPMCGNEELEPGEQCDGEGISCAEYDDSRYFGGNAPCTENCTYNLDNCVDCIGQGQLCNPNQPLCCAGLTCTMGGLEVLPRCQTP